MIFRLACVDSGITGRSLALVSNHIRDVSGPYRLRSISLHGPEEIQSFLTLLERTPTHLRRVRNIFISTQRRDDWKICWEVISQRLPGPHVKPEDVEAMAAILEGRDPFSVAGISSPVDFYRNFQTAVSIWRGHTAHLALPMALAIEAILSMVAPTLNILELDISPIVYAHLKGDTDFPRLQELTSHSGYPLVRNIYHKSSTYCYPSLRRLHLRHSFKHHQVSNFTAIIHISLFAPRLTHVFFSNLHLQDPWARGIRLRDLPGTVKHTLLTYGNSPDCGPERIQGPVITPMEVNDTVIAPKHNRVLLLPDQQNRPCYGSKFFCWPVSESQWLSRISGHEGCWLDEESG